MAEITDQDRAVFRERGYVVVPGVLSDAQRWREAVTSPLLEFA